MNKKEYQETRKYILNKAQDIMDAKQQNQLLVF